MDRSLELDHWFILCPPGAAAAERLISLGLIEGEPNTHPGQGTANRRFFFDNSMLELLWVHDPVEAKEGPGRDLQLPARVASPLASPFGLVFRGAEGEGAAAPFPGWRYDADYLPAPAHFLVGDDSAVLVEPLCFSVQFATSRPPGGRAMRVSRG